MPNYLQDLGQLPEIFENIARERQSQDKKWGSFRYHDPAWWSIVLAEKVEEACKALLENSKNQYEYELIQVAAVAVAALEDLYNNG